MEELERKLHVTLGWINFFFTFPLNAHKLNTYKIFLFNILMCVLNILCAFSWNKKEKLTARMHGVEIFKKYENGVFYKGRAAVFYFPPALKFMKSRTQNNGVLLR